MHDSTHGPSPGRAKGSRVAASSYLKLRPVHGHARPVVGSEPPQVLHRVGSFEALLQFTVNVFVAKSERSVTLGKQGWPHSSQPSASTADFTLGPGLPALAAGWSSGLTMHR